MGAGASESAGGSGRAARALRLLLLLVLALAYLFCSIFDTIPLKTYLYMPLHNATQLTTRSGDHRPCPEKLPYAADLSQSPKIRNTTHTNSTQIRTSKRRPETPNTNSTSSPPLNMTRKGNEDSTALLIAKIMDTMKNLITTEGVGLRKNETAPPLCNLPLDLGPIPVNKTDMELDVVEKKFPEVNWGGRYSPPNCTARHIVAIIAPYRNRRQHLAIFLNHMHPFLMKQQIEYGIFIVEQKGYQNFNRAKLMNVGFVVSQKLKVGGWQCFIFHDIDLLPLDLRNLYSCPRQPRHMSVSIDNQNFSIPHPDLFGGVSAMTLRQFKKVNGFSNRYWGWGGEDDDMFFRMHKMNYHIARYNMSVARYAMLNHKKSSPNPRRYQLLSQASRKFSKDGLSTLKYKIFKVTHYHLYTHILVNIDERS